MVYVYITLGLIAIGLVASICYAVWVVWTLFKSLPDDPNSTYQ